MSTPAVSVRNHRPLKVDESTNASAEAQPRFQVPEPPANGKVTDRSILFLGFDWGTNKTCLKGGYPATPGMALEKTIPTVVGYAKEGIVDGLLPDNATVLFGENALRHRLHLNLVHPMVDGVVKDRAVARDFVKHLRAEMGVPAGTEIRTVIGVPANADQAARDSVRECVAGIIDRVLLIPEPFLAALGYRDETRLTDPGYVDPVRNSLFIDIGGGTTDVCLVQGYYPTADDQISLPFAGDKVDALFYNAVRKTYPDCELSSIRVRELKEQYSFVGKASTPVLASVMVAGKPRKIDITEQLGNACQELLKITFETAKQLVARASSDGVAELLRNIVITGGGSRIRGIDVELQRMLVEDGYEGPCVRLAGDRYKEFVALGALKAARQARENQWQQVIK